MSRETDIAIVGVGARFPDAWGPEQFWRNISAGSVSMRAFSDDELRAAAVDEASFSAADYVRVGVRLPGVAEFAAEFFGIPPAEAEVTDPYQRIFMEVCWEALEASGHPPVNGGPVTGVYAGTSFSTYAMILYLAKAREAGFAAIADGELRRGSQPDFMPARVAHRLGLRGPAVAVQTACSGSLTAVHLATQALLAGDCDIALAGGAGGVAPEAGYRYEAGGIAAADGYCRSFDATSTGTATGAGVGVVVLRRLADALADGDHVWAVLEGSAVNNDGADRPGFTAPSPQGVTDVVRCALAWAEVSADRLCYVEAHGSGTPLGDHVELLGLSEALRASTRRTGFCGLGSVKANVGHCGAAAGIAGLIKAVHIAHTGGLPPQPMFTSPRDPGVLADSAFRIDTGPRRCAEPGRRVLVHSMGQGGTNAAVVLAPPPAPTVSRAPNGALTNPAPPVRLVVSARTRTALDEASRALAGELEAGTHALADVVHTLRVGRRHFAHRRVVTGSPRELVQALRLPRPPLARTVRAEPLIPLVVGASAGSAAPSVQQILRDGLGSGARTAETVPELVPAGSFLLAIGPDTVRLAGPGESGIGHTVPLTADGVDEALTLAWVHGVEVDWAAVAPTGRRRVPLPTYPFQRRRFWALDRLGDVLRSTPAGPGTAVRRSSSTVSGERPDALPRATLPADSLEADLVTVWEELFGISPVGVDDEFDLLGGTSLLATRMALEIAQRHQVRLNLHRVGGTRATVRRIAGVIRAHRAVPLAGPGAGPDGGRTAVGGGETPDGGEALDGDGALVDADVELPLGPVAATRPGPAVLLTGATGFLGAFVLRELVASGAGPIHCLVRAADEERGWLRLRAAAASWGLPPPDRGRVRVVIGDLADVAAALVGRWELAATVGQVVHCAAQVVFTEPYRALRRTNVLATAELLRWARAHGVPEFTYVSSLAACTPVGGPPRRVSEEREQPLSAESGGYGTGKWVSERLLERAERDGLRVRLFRPGLILGDSVSGACNPKDMVWRLLAGGLATGTHPADDRPLFMAPVDVVARAIVSMARAPGSVGRAHHLVHTEPASLRTLFAWLGAAGLPTEPVPARQWQSAVAEQALRTRDEVLSAVALLNVDDEAGPVCVEAGRWQDWLAGQGLSAEVTGAALARSMRYLTGQPAYRDLLGRHSRGGRNR